VSAEEANWLCLRMEAVGSDWRVLNRGRVGGDHWVRVGDPWTGRQIVLDSPQPWLDHRAALADAWNLLVPVDLPFVEVGEE